MGFGWRLGRVEMMDWPRMKPKSATNSWVRDAVANVIVARHSFREPCGAD
jgi:hypothetical protein